MRSQQGKVVVITGGTAGVGRATARRFAADGARVAILARGEDGLDAVAHEIFRLGGQALAIPTDVAHPAQVFAAADRVERELGMIDIWINNAMTTVFGRVDQIDPAELRRVTDVTYHGYVWGTQAALRAMRARDRGTIVQVGSALAYRAIPLQAAYCAAKHAIRAFTDALHSELIHDGSNIHLTTVQLPAINTPQFRWCENKLGVEAQPVPPIFQPEIAAEAIFFAARHRRREVWLGTSAIKAILGQKLVPGLLDRYLAGRGFDGQTTGVPRPRRPSNLWSPVAGDHGAHGAFEFRARRRDLVARVGTWLGAAGVQALAIALAITGLAATSFALGRKLSSTG
jgi:NAD(P)-dependent dehydrogenase (short-subunit alcohol dehydrogenase family)